MGPCFRRDDNASKTRALHASLHRRDIDWRYFPFANAANASA